MAVQFAVLASGSRGNSTYIGGPGAGLLIDIGLSTRALDGRLKAVGASWSMIGAVLLTHTHSDHIDPAPLAEMARRGISLHCHSGHQEALADHPGFQELERAGRVHVYDDEPFLTTTAARVDPIRLSHDGGPTYGFHIEVCPARRGPAARIGYLADTGRWSELMVDRLVDVDLLAVEFNHDAEMQRSAPRPAHLIARNLGDRGHLSNNQAGELVRRVVARSRPDRPRDLVLLHLSEQCNTPELALEAARSAAGEGRHVHAARQGEPHPRLMVEPRRSTPSRPRSSTHARPRRPRSPALAMGSLFDQDSPLDPTPVETS